MGWGGGWAGSAAVGGFVGEVWGVVGGDFDGEDGAGAISDIDLGAVGGWGVWVIIEEVSKVLCGEEGCCEIVIEVGHRIFEVEGFGPFVDEEIV